MRTWLICLIFLLFNYQHLEQYLIYCSIGVQELCLVIHNCITCEINLKSTDKSWSVNSINVHVQDEFSYNKTFAFQRTWKWVNGKNSEEKIWRKILMGPAVYTSITCRLLTFKKINLILEADLKLIESDRENKRRNRFPFSLIWLSSVFQSTSGYV